MWQLVKLRVAMHREWHMRLEEVLLASKKTGDDTPTWERLINTKLFVSVLTKEPGPEISDFRFDLRKSSHDGNLYIVVSENLENLERSGGTTAIRENAFKLLNMIRPELGVLIALSGDEDFYIPPGLIDWIRKNTQPMVAQSER